MNTDIVVGKTKQRKGKLKEEIGKVTGDTDMEITGLAEQATGKIQEEYGKVERNLKKIVKDQSDSIYYVRSVKAPSLS